MKYPPPYWQMSTTEQLREGCEELQRGGLPQLPGGDGEGEASLQFQRHQDLPVRQGLRSSVPTAGGLPLCGGAADHAGKLSSEI